MKKIGEGYYYNVYDIGNGRVLKKQKDKFSIFFHILVTSKGSVIHAYKKSKEVSNTILKLRKEYEEILNKVSDTSLLGNPTLLQGIDYTQDKADRVREDVNLLSEQQFTLLIINYTNLIKQLWTFGINESVYNFTLNNGYNTEGEYILVDFNEVTFDIEKVLQDIKSKFWLGQWAYQLLSETHKKIFRELMEKEISEENLKKCWPSRRLVTNPL
jgi:hypothetical protein